MSKQAQLPALPSLTEDQSTGNMLHMSFLLIEVDLEFISAHISVFATIRSLSWYLKS